MPQQIIISSTPEEVRMGLVDNGILQEFMVERAMSAHLVGSIFLGRSAILCGEYRPRLSISGWIRTHFCIWAIPRI